jgi:GntP family gluconate:H+ symporter
MQTLAAFAIALSLSFLLLTKARIQPFLSLVVSSIVYGLLCGMGAEIPDYVGSGLGSVFSSLALVILAGAVMAEHLRKTGSMATVMNDLSCVTGRHRTAAAAISGYLISLPVMCCITSYMILEPVFSASHQPGESRKKDLFMLAAASTISFVLVYPSPVVVSASRTLGVSAIDAATYGIPISLLALIASYLFIRWFSANEEQGLANDSTKKIPEGTIESSGNAGSTDEPGRCIAENAGSGSCAIHAKGLLAKGTLTTSASRAYAWSPLILPLVLIAFGAFMDNPGARLIGDPGIALLCGAMLSVAQAAARFGRKAGGEIISAASRRAGVILLDLCGAGAFGYVVSKSSFSVDLMGAAGALPSFAVPFAVAALLQLAIGGRVVTAVIASRMMADYPLDNTAVLLLICAGAMAFSSLTDPFFWLVRDTAGADIKETLIGYTVVLCICSAVVVIFAALSLYIPA